MKIRNGFVSNSSSSSFVIDMCESTSITKKQLNEIINAPSDLGFKIKIKDGAVIGTTTGDNSRMHEYLRDFVKVNEEIIIWEYN